MNADGAGRVCFRAALKGIPPSLALMRNESVAPSHRLGIVYQALTLCRRSAVKRIILSGVNDRNDRFFFKVAFPNDDFDLVHLFFSRSPDGLFGILKFNGSLEVVGPAAPTGIVGARLRVA